MQREYRHCAVSADTLEFNQQRHKRFQVTIGIMVQPYTQCMVNDSCGNGNQRVAVRNMFLLLRVSLVTRDRSLFQTQKDIKQTNQVLLQVVVMSHQEDRSCLVSGHVAERHLPYGCQTDSHQRMGVTFCGVDAINSGDQRTAVTSAPAR